MFGLDSIQPAYGRDYNNKGDVLKDFNNNKDFKTPFGQAINKIDIKRLYPNLKSISIRYAALRKVMRIEL